LPVNATVSLPATYAFGGARWFGPGEGRLRPMIEAGVGVAHLSPGIRATVGGFPVPDDVIDDFRPVDFDSNELLMVVGGGITIGLTPALAVDAGYRFFHLAVDEEAPASNTSMVYAGLRLRFGR
jgi:opacity protein-like surface antigen